MGVLISKLLASFNKLVDKKILMLGLDAAGKSTLLYKLKLGENVQTLPTIGFNVEGIETSNNVMMTVWDVGGQDKLRPLWKHYFRGSDALVFVVDSSDTTRMQEAREELERILYDEEVQQTCHTLLVMANKQDLPAALPVSDISDKLGLKNLRAVNWYIQPCVAVSGEGCHEGIDWLARQLRK